MNDIASSSASLEEVKQHLQETQPSSLKAIPVELFSGLGKFSKVINNQSDVSVSMRESEAEIKLANPVYVSSILLTLATFESVKGIKLVVLDVLTGKKEKLSITVEKTIGPVVRFPIKKVITSFVIHRESLFQRQIKNIQVFGIFLDELQKFEDEFKVLTSYHKQISDFLQERESELNDQAAKIKRDQENADENIADMVSALKEVEGQRDALIELNDSTQAALGNLKIELDRSAHDNSQLLLKNEELERKKINLESELVQKQQTLSGVNIAIAKSEEKLKGLVNNVNVFTEEFSGFVGQGANQVRLYTVMTVVPFVILIVVVYNLFAGAVDLSTKFEEIPNIDLLTILVTRIPFILIAGLLVGVSVKVLYFLTNRIIAIHQQRLDLAKIAIIAKDVSDASAAGLSMSEDDLYEAKTYLKMSILKGYLAEQIEKFTYSKRKRDADVNGQGETSDSIDSDEREVSA